MNGLPTIIIDTREQKPFYFGALKIRGVKEIPTERGTLHTGDYTIKGLETKFVIERKSVGDLCGTLTGGHERFLREMERIKDFEMAYIIIEGMPSDVARHCSQYGMIKAVDMIFQSLVAYAYHYRVRIKFCKDTGTATDYAARKILEFWQMNGVSD